MNFRCFQRYFVGRCYVVLDNPQTLVQNYYSGRLRILDISLLSQLNRFITMHVVERENKGFSRRCVPTRTSVPPERLIRRMLYIVSRDMMIFLREVIRQFYCKLLLSSEIVNIEGIVVVELVTRKTSEFIVV